MTLEPCAMCAGALLQARVDRIVYGTRNHLLGAHGSWVDILSADALQSGRQLDVEGGAAAAQGSNAWPCSISNTAVYQHPFHHGLKVLLPQNSASMHTLLATEHRVCPRRQCRERCADPCGSVCGRERTADEKFLQEKAKIQGHAPEHKSVLATLLPCMTQLHACPTTLAVMTTGLPVP